MADQRLTDLTELTTPADGDYLYIVDVSDTTDSSGGTSKKAQVDNVRGWPQTSAESTAGVTPTNLQYEPGDIRRYGGAYTATASTNDTAIANALSSNQVVKIPYEGDGEYEITSPVDLDTLGHTIIGDPGVSLKAVTGFPTTGGAALQAIINISERRCSIQGLILDCNSIALHGLYATGANANRMYVHRVYVSNSTGDGILCGDGCYLSHFHIVRVDSAGGYGFNFDSSGGQTTMHLSNCYVVSASTGGFRFDNVSGFVMDACAADNISGYAIVLESSASGTANGFYTEDTTQLYSITGGSSSLIVNGGRHSEYGDNATPPANVINTFGNLEVRGVVFLLGESSTVFANLQSTSDVIWKHNSIQLGDQTNTFTFGASLEVPPSDQETATGTFTASVITPITLIDSSGGAVTCTLPNGKQYGQKKIFRMTDATNSSTLSVTTHETSNPEVFTFADANDSLVLMWNGTLWFTMNNQGAAV